MFEKGPERSFIRAYVSAEEYKIHDHACICIDNVNLIVYIIDIKITIIIFDE